MRASAYGRGDFEDHCTGSEAIRLRPALKKLFKLLAKQVPGHDLRAALFRACGFKIGKDVYIAEDMIVAEILEDNSEKLIIGDRVAIGPRVTFVTSSDPNRSRLAPELIPPIRGCITVRNDAWIGAGAIILPNITIGEGSVVGAGAVVTKDVPPRAIVAGVPATIVRFIVESQRLEADQENNGHTRPFAEP